MERWVLGVDPATKSGISVHRRARKPIWSGRILKTDWYAVERFLAEGVILWRGKWVKVVDWPEWDPEVHQRLLVREDQYVGEHMSAVIPVVAAATTWEVLAARRGWSVVRRQPAQWRVLQLGRQTVGMKRKDLKRLAKQMAQAEFGLKVTDDEAEAIYLGCDGVTLQNLEGLLARAGVPDELLERLRRGGRLR